MTTLQLSLVCDLNVDFKNKDHLVGMGIELGYLCDSPREKRERTYFRVILAGDVQLKR